MLAEPQLERKLQRKLKQFIGCDAHKKFSVFASTDEAGVHGRTTRVTHERKVFREYLRELLPGSEIALETSGCYYWIVDDMEQAGHYPRLLRPGRLSDG